VTSELYSELVLCKSEENKILEWY